MCWVEGKFHPEDEMHRGWIKAYRKEPDSAIWNKPPVYYKVWRWLLYQVDRHTGTWDGSVRDIAKGVQWTENRQVSIPSTATIQRVLEFMELERMLERDLEREPTRITILNWHLYNPQKEEPGTDVGTDVGTTAKQQRNTHNNNVVQEVKEVKDSLSSARARELPKLDQPNPLSRFLSLYRDKYPGNGHPLRGLPQDRIENDIQRVNDLVAAVGESESLRFLNTALYPEEGSKKFPPTTVREAVQLCKRLCESEQKGKEKSDGSQNGNVPKLWSRGIVKYNPDAGT